MDRERVERQLKMAQQAQSAVESELDKQKVAADARAKSPKWRKADADRRAIVRRLNAIKGVEDREAAAIERKSQKEGGQVLEAAE